MNFEQLEESAFDNFDPDFYDPEADGFDSPDGKRKGKSGLRNAPQVVRRKAKAYFDLVFTNPSASVLTFELFNALRSFTRAIRQDFSPNAAVYGYYPLATREGLEALINNVIPVGNRTPANESNTLAAGFVGFDKNGSLIITPDGAYNVATIGKIVCNQFPYSGLLQSSSEQPFKITRVRMTTTNDPQISNPIVLFRNSFLGSKAQNEINPRNFFSPNQFQNRIIDVPVDFVINGQSGILYSLNAGETVQWNVEVESYHLNTVE